MNRWRCKVCETLNTPDRSTCIVCDFEREIGKETKTSVQQNQISKCRFPDCHSLALKNQEYCEYHLHTVCPICHQKLKSSGLDYCVECGLKLTEEHTAGLRKINKVFQIADVSLGITFIILLISYFLL